MLHLRLRLYALLEYQQRRHFMGFGKAMVLDPRLPAMGSLRVAT